MISNCSWRQRNISGLIHIAHGTYVFGHSNENFGLAISPKLLTHHIVEFNSNALGLGAVRQGLRPSAATAGGPDVPFSPPARSLLAAAAAPAAAAAAAAAGRVHLATSSSKSTSKPWTMPRQSPNAAACGATLEAIASAAADGAAAS